MCARGISISKEIAIQLPPAYRIEVAKQTPGVIVPTPPHVASKRPEALLGGSNEAIEGAGFANHGRHLGCGFGQHPDFIFPKMTGLDRLDHENALQDASVDERDPEERLVRLFARFLEVFETGMASCSLDGYRKDLLGDQTREAFVDCHSKGSDTLRAKSQRCGQDQVGAIGFQQIG
jgi:hypothetical protein